MSTLKVNTIQNTSGGSSSTPEEIKKGTRVNQIMRHTVGLYHGQHGANKWKRYLSDNMMARDSDFQKVKHIMTIAQNNEKANQASS